MCSLFNLLYLLALHDSSDNDSSLFGPRSTQTWIAWRENRTNPRFLQSRGSKTEECKAKVDGKEGEMFNTKFPRERIFNYKQRRKIF